MACPPGKACLQLCDMSAAVLDTCEGDVQDLVHFDVPSIHVELESTLRLSPLEHVRRHSVTEKRDSEEESESTAL